MATDSAGSIVWQASYTPFGGIHQVSVNAGALSAQDLRFPGQWFQSETGLHQNWHRDYDPTTGRYLQADPLGLVDGPSVYGYARQSPLRYIDPTGLSLAEFIEGLRSYADGLYNLGKFTCGLSGFCGPKNKEYSRKDLQTLLEILKQLEKLYARYCLSLALDFYADQKKYAVAGRLSAGGIVTAVGARIAGTLGLVGGVGISAGAGLGSILGGIRTGNGLLSLTQAVYGDVPLPPEFIPGLPCQCLEILREFAETH